MLGLDVGIHAVQDLFSSATPYELAVNVPYALAFALVAAEVAWLATPAGPTRGAITRSAATATAMAAGAFVVGILYTAILRHLWEAVASVGWEPAAGFWRAHAVVGAIVTFVAWDLAGWCYHLVGHRTRVGWAAHQAHHSGQGYDATLGLRQSWAPFHGLAIYPFLALAGFDLRVAFVCAAVSNCWQVLEHTSLPVRFPTWVAAHVMTPAAHRHHHGRDGGLVNLGPFFTWWDRIAGTWVPPDDPAPVAYAPDGPRASGNPITVELAGWVALATGGDAYRRVRKNTPTCPATMTGMTRASQGAWLRSSAGTQVSQTRPSTTRMAVHQPIARREPPAAFTAITNPEVTTTTATTRSARTMSMATRSAPPSRLTVSATTVLNTRRRAPR